MGKYLFEILPEIHKIFKEFLIIQNILKMVKTFFVQTIIIQTQPFLHFSLT